MNNRTLMGCIERLGRGETATLSFLSPIVSAGLAAWFLHDPPSRRRVTLEGDAVGYSRALGFHTLLQDEVCPNPAPARPHSMSPLTSLASHAEVDACNERVTSILGKTMSLEEHASTNSIKQLVGELHDNVASHAQGRGYSALQVYAERAEFAVCDFGQGFRRNVRRVDPSIDTHEKAIAWALVKGNTTAKPRDPFAQRDSREYDEQVEPNHHLGLGLWRLVQLVEQAGGKLWIWSGDATYERNGKDHSFHRAPVSWPGVMIELEIPKLTTPPVLVDFSREDLEAVAAELGI